MKTLYLVANDTGPDSIVAITDRDSGAVVDLTGTSSVQLKVRPRGSVTTSFTITPTVESAPLGTIRIVWGSSLVSLAAGNYEGELQFTISGKIVSMFDLLSIVLRADFT